MNSISPSQKVKKLPAALHLKKVQPRKKMILKLMMSSKICLVVAMMALKKKRMITDLLPIYIFNQQHSE